MNDFDSVREFYRLHEEQIMAPAAGWPIDPYAWCAVGIVMTPIEKALWEDIRAERAIFHPQYPVGRYFVDFGNPVAKVAIECDGKAYHLDVQRDAARQAEIERLGWTVYRITGRDCFTDFHEEEDEYGRSREVEGAALRLIRRICDRHPVRIGAKAKVAA